MSRVTAAFVCALCDPDNPRPASIMCSNNCGRYVCAAHATPRKGPGSAMVCLSCADALGLIERPKPRPAPEVRPLIETTPEPVKEPAPAPIPDEPKLEQAKPVMEAATVSSVIDKPVEPVAPPAEQVTIVTPPSAPPPPKESVVIDHSQPSEPRSAVRLNDTGPAPKSVASETVVSQRGNTLQVPKVSPSLGKPPQPIAPQPRKALRSTGSGNGPDWTLIGMAAGTVVLGIVGFVMILAALAG